MNINKNIVSAEFISRPNRFQAYVKLNNEIIMVHVPNTGRCKEILIPKTTVILREENGINRKTKYDLIAGYKGDKLINIDSQIPNKLVYEALLQRKISKLKKFNTIEKEKMYGNSRFDFKLTDSNGNIYYLEVKGVTYEENGNAKFPDAPTERGTKHLTELIDVKKDGMSAGAMFILQMDNMKSFSPYDSMDPKFAEALKKAKENGVDIFAYECNVGEEFITISNEINVIIK
ncbi:sugar fermentation stimulation protein-like protein [Clostridium pasteurianum DSM 525 = ATCC 6013]|uniref:Sugar fermentation stimulation protein homolog n=1 Tax=Clostridium pasteurianum DSM 525 = ATCC 6013 TaxID=1262449 RepID=A0A0H3J0J6_CLOPA|nr:DNA/RNA nuclease SfsA [Clostridium pasteurianum]AJA46187.1 sugar fermentation stimulation protein-like protein [Clostridium pasteurianum DSM 525 = ATCC 6013]AJA50175.1 sugar fermentation stimulation protein [Clostridium pasteurianum DSM 525 = ATCC 6013]AOZ73646.1 XRE family transcriptional regulator [Clostridium pasteurianum DSM 525 = ATCC 6013]AOZ77443.1 XRE family transcriptional regulator [Clostridium pasteurianum]ELP57455.1 DNA-binding transcriptional regulator [Clostridium pasteurianum